MTPEERATKVVEWITGQNSVADNIDWEVKCVAKAITAAEEAEREACAKVADKFATEAPTCQQIGCAVPGCIRARGTA